MSALSVHQANDIFERIAARRERFADEDEHTSFMVVLLNYGDHLTAVSCIGGEWSGVKADLTPRDGVPLCPFGHPLMESNARQRLGLVDEQLPTFPHVPGGSGRFA